MRNILLLIFCLLMLHNNINAQENVFILVDVSGSISMNKSNQAKEVVRNIILGNPINNPDFSEDLDPKSNIKIGSGKPITGKNKYVLLMPFGDKKTCYNYKLEKLNNFPADFNQFLDNTYPTQFNNENTYITLAQAKAAEIAKNNKISNYCLFIISDGIDDFTGGKSPNYSQYEEDLIKNYNSKSFPVSSPSDGCIILKSATDFKINIKHVDISKYVAPPKTGSGSEKSFEIKIQSHANGKKNNEKVVKTDDVKLSWTCSGCPKGIRYKISIRGYDGNKNKENKETSSISYSTNLENGKYRITISAVNNNNDITIKSDKTYIQVNTGGGYGWLIVLIFFAIGYIVYYLWKKIIRDPKEKKLTGSNNELPFTT